MKKYTMPVVKSEPVYPNTKFLSYGHLCELQLHEEEVYEMHRRGITSRLKRLWRHVYTANASSPLTRKFLRSQASVENEIDRHFKANYWVIHPLSRFYFWWQSLYVLLILIGSITNPLDHYLTLPFGDRITFLIVVSYIADAVDIIDVCLHFFIGYYDDKIGFSLDLKQIACHYLKTTFFLRLLCAIPYYAIFRCYAVIRHGKFEDMWYTKTHNWIDAFNAFTYFRIFVALGYYRRMGETVQLRIFCRSIFEVLVMSFVTLHWLACLHIRTYPGDTSSFAMLNNLHSQPLSVRYCFCIFQVATLCTNINVFEKDQVRLKQNAPYDDFYMACCNIACRLMVLTTTAQILRLLRVRSAIAIEYDGMVSKLEYFMRYKQLPHLLRKKVRRYYMYRYNKTYFNEKKIIESTTGQLRQDLILNNCKRMLQRVVLFRNMPYALLQQVVARLQDEVYTVNEVIIRSGSRGQSMYFISAGTVAVYSPLGRELCHMQDGEYFGEVGIISRDKRYRLSVIAIETCNLYRLDRKDFEETISPFPDLLDTVKRQAIEIIDVMNKVDLSIRKR